MPPAPDEPGLLAIEATHCIRCASCSSIAPEIFVVAKISRVVRQPVGPSERSACHAAALNCPTGAIVWRASTP